MRNIDVKAVEHIPLVSVIMATYNERPDIIDAAIRSILNQEHENIELLIADDSTRQSTIDTIDSYAADERVTIIRENKRMGLSRSRNVCLEAARGDYIAVMDGDDVSLSDRFTKQVKFLEEHRKVYVLGGQIDIIDEDTKKISFRKYPSGRICLFLFSTVRNPVAHPAVMMRRELIERGFRYDEKLAMSEDLDLWLRVMYHGYRVANLDTVVLNYRVGKNFTERRTSRAQIEYMAEVRRKNFCWKHPLHSILSCFFAWIFLNMPVRTIQMLYQNENGRKVKT